MLNKILIWVIRSPLGIWVLVISMTSILTLGGLAGYRTCNWVWETKENKALENYLETIEEKDKVIREREKQLALKNSEDQIKVRTVVREIPKYITLDNCRINDDGVQYIRDQVTDLFPETK